MLKKILSRYAQLYIQFLPIIVFLWTARAFNFTDTGWMYAFYIGSALAIAQTIILVLCKILCNRFLLAVNLFLIIGSIAFLTQAGFLLQMYEQYQQVMLFVMLVFVGIITTCCTQAGFVGVDSSSPSYSSFMTKRFSLYLLGASVLGLILAYVLRGYGLVSGAIIFGCLRLLSEYFEKRLNNNYK